MDAVELLTNSRATTFRRCRREHFFRYELQRGPIAEDESLQIGRAFHDAVEAWRKMMRRAASSRNVNAGDADGRFGRHMLATCTEVLARPFILSMVRGSPIDGYVQAKTEELFRGYHYRWFDEDVRFGYAGVEEEFSLPLVNPRTNRRSKLWRQSGKMDATQQRGDRLYLVETKTTSKKLDPASGYFQRLELDSQVSTYYAAGKAMGLDFAGCIYDVARKPQISPHRETPEADRKYTQGKKCKLCVPAHEECPHCHGTGWIEAPRLYANQRDSDETVDDFRFRVRQAIAEAPDEYYRRALVPRRDDELEEHRKDLWMTARDIRDCKRLGTHPRNPDACERYNRFCPYWATCTGQADIFDNGVYRDVEKHPELGRGST